MLVKAECENRRKFRCLSVSIFAGVAAQSNIFFVRRGSVAFLNNKITGRSELAQKNRFAEAKAIVQTRYVLFF